MESGIFAVCVGDTHLYGPRHATKEETYNIRIRNVVGGGWYAVSLAGEIDRLVMYGIEAINGAKIVLDNRTDP